MPDTSSSATNPKQVASARTETTGGELEPRRAQIIDIETRLETGPEVGSQRSIDPRRLYEVFSTETGRFEVDVSVALISETFFTSLMRLRRRGRIKRARKRESYLSGVVEPPHPGTFYWSLAGIRRSSISAFYGI